MSARTEDRRSENGFTLIELIVVIVILGLLAAVVGPKITGRLAQSKEKIAKIQITQIEGALQYFTFEIGRLPTTAEGLEALVSNPSNSDAWHGPYLEKGLPKDPWGRPYIYRCPGVHGDFDLFSAGADGTEGTDDDVCSWK